MCSFLHVTAASLRTTLSHQSFHASWAAVLIFWKKWGRHFCFEGSDLSELLKPKCGFSPVGALPCDANFVLTQQPSSLSHTFVKQLIVSVFLIFPFIFHCLSPSLFVQCDPVLRPVTHIPQGTMLTVNTSSNVSIKTEPVSPGRDRSTPCPPPSSTTPSSTSGGAILTSPPQYPGSLLSLEPPTGRSPADSVSSNASSFEGSDRDDGGTAGGGGSGAGGGSITGSISSTSRSVPPDFSPSAELLRASSEQEQDGGNIKRMRLDAWVT